MISNYTDCKKTETFFVSWRQKKFQFFYNSIDYTKIKMKKN